MSISSQDRVRLFKTMNASRKSTASPQHSRGTTSPDLTTSDFDPENEAMMSTRQLDNNNLQQLPELRASAQKYRRPSRFESDYAIDTSALGRAFPEFSQGNSSSDDGSLSIEIGRGVKKSSNVAVNKAENLRGKPSVTQATLDEDSLDFKAPMVGEYEVTGTPPLRQQKPSKQWKEKGRGLSVHDARTRRASGPQPERLNTSPPEKAKDYGSGESRQGSEGTRRTLAAMHARVRGGNDVSHIGDERPPTIDLTVKSTRFGKVNNQHHASNDPALPTRYTSANGLADTFNSSSKQKHQHTMTSNQGTQQSFVLPDLPNMSELVSGVFEDGTPVFSRHGRSRASRYATSNGQRKSNNQYAGVEEVPVPYDEQAIFLSLKLFQDKVAVLEGNRAGAENLIHHLEEENRSLKAEKAGRRKVSRRSESALSTSDSDAGEGAARGLRKAVIERNRLETSIRALQTQLDASTRKASTAEIIIRTVTQERDSAVSQLSIAFVTIEQLKVEKESLISENQGLKSRLAQSSGNHVNGKSTVMAKDKSFQCDLSNDRGTIKSKSNDADEANRKHEKSTIMADLQRNVRSNGKSNRQAHASPQKNGENLFDLRSRREVTKEAIRDQYTSALIDDSEASDSPMHETMHETTTKQSKAIPFSKLASSSRSNQPEKTNAAQDVTYLSFLETGEIARLRETLEHERVERKQRQAARSQHSASNFIQHAEHESNTVPRKTAMARKSSMKVPQSVQVEKTQSVNPVETLDCQADHRRRHSETSILSAGRRQRGQNAENMTSAFIIPDITIHGRVAEAQAPVLTQGDHEILDGLANHQGQSCTICKRIDTCNESHGEVKASKHSITIPKPTPVSDRVRTEGVGDEDPTMRPAQAPGLALATVLKGLEDEIVHLKIELAKYQSLYSSHDPALSKRKRIMVSQKIKHLLEGINIKADQVYALYDVLEGQKQDGHELSEDEVEITLQSIGLEAPALQLRGGGGEDHGKQEEPAERQPWDLTSDDEGPEEWQGIESTIETTKSGFARANGGAGLL